MDAWCKAEVFGWNDSLWSRGPAAIDSESCPFLLFVHASEVVGILISVGLAVQFWGIVAHYYDSGRPSKD